MSRTQDKIHHLQERTYAGVDVGKVHLDLFVQSVNLHLRVKNDAPGIANLKRQCIKHGVCLVALEATGKYHRAAHEHLHDAGVPVAVVNPFRSRQFAGSLGQLAKTDRVDAKILASFAERLQPEPTVPASENHQVLRDLNTARRQVLDNIGDLKRQLQSTDHALVAKQIRTRIKMAERHKTVLEDEMQGLINTAPDLKRKFAILTSIPNIGPVTATVLISELTELGHTNCKQIAALAGVAPMSWDSGSKNGKRMIRGGRKPVRNALYMCAVGSSKRSGSLGGFYRKLVENGKHPKIALTAVMRKLVILANTLITEDWLWQATAP